MRVLVAVASRHGALAEIAAEICMNLRHALPGGAIQADLVAAGETPALDGYDAVIIGSPIAGSRWLSALVRQQRELPRLPLWLFSTWADGDPAARDDRAVPADSTVTDADVIEHRMFGAKTGAGIRAADGDFRDWAAVRAWVTQIVERLAATPLAQAG